MVWCGMVWYGIALHGMAWHGMAWYGMVWYGMVRNLTLTFSSLISSEQLAAPIVAVTADF